MKRIFSALLSLGLIMSTMSGAIVSAADPIETDRLEVTATPTAKVGEPIDLTIKALAKDGSVVKNYEGTIFIIVENDNKATVPYQDGYKFVVADQGQKTFSKGLAFTKEGSLKVVASDFDKPKIEGSIKVKVGGGTDAPVATGTESVTITSPDNNSTLGNANFSVVGATKKSSKVQLFVNGAKALESQTDDKGAFLFEVKNTSQAKNILSVKVLDGTDKVIGESSKITVTAGSDGPEFKSLKLSSPTAIAGATVGVTLEATPGLKAVVISAGSAIATLKEGLVPGTYSGDVIAPVFTGALPIDVSLRNDLGKETLKAAVGTLTVTTPVVTYKNIKTEIADKKVTLTFEIDNAPAGLSKFEIAYSKTQSAMMKPIVAINPAAMSGAVALSGSLVNSGTRIVPPAPEIAQTTLSDAVRVTTLEASRIRNSSGAYTWYIPNLDIALYSMTISAVGADGKVILGSSSEPISVDLSLASAGKCLIGNIAGLTLKK